MDILRKRISFSSEEALNIADCYKGAISELNFNKYGEINHNGKTYRIHLKIYWDKCLNVKQTITTDKSKYNATFKYKEPNDIYKLKKIYLMNLAMLYIKFDWEYESSIYSSKTHYYNHLLIAQAINSNDIIEEDIKDKLIFLDFLKEDELALSIYYLLNHISKVSEDIFELFENKLNYAGYELSDFKDSTFNYNEYFAIQSNISKTKNNKNLIVFMLGYVAFIVFNNGLMHINKKYISVIANEFHEAYIKNRGED